MANTTGVYPVYEKPVQDRQDRRRRLDREQSFRTIADMESFSVSIDGNIEEWKPLISRVDKTFAHW